MKKDPCWIGYKMVGMKKKGKRKVPNCVKESVSDDVLSLALASKSGFAHNLPRLSKTTLSAVKAQRYRDDMMKKARDEKKAGNTEKAENLVKGAKAWHAAFKAAISEPGAKELYDRDIKNAVERKNKILDDKKDSPLHKPKTEEPPKTDPNSLKGRIKNVAKGLAGAALTGALFSVAREIGSPQDIRRTRFR